MPQLAKRDGVWALNLDDDQNQFTDGWLTVVEAALSRIEAEPGSALVTLGTGKFFSTGLALEATPLGSAGFAAYIARAETLLARVLTLPVPTVAAVTGHAFGAGAMFALAHDYRVMREDKGYICLPEVDLGMPFTTGMHALLAAKLTPRARTAAMISGRRFGAQEALDFELVDSAAPEGSVAAVALELAGKLVGKDPSTLTAIKTGLYAEALQSLGNPLEHIPGGVR
ncbi:enoyl-CoA hydratase/carnithine racemase [Arthrobacter woluwensis]|uniref:enoyl-CoA hydratase-related protein n=1 Tax=Arthrobacter woluwensis TaxID=156980 RepID=UPI00277F81DE|nr:enoyl-CoA hydratase-related protein [Arthrobacter woluwensis]MDQ0708617.1 enoyl-CoA hydratase/carnithine racemase [Arthrobacter woluwensis]